MSYTYDNNNNNNQNQNKNDSNKTDNNNTVVDCQEQDLNDLLFGDDEDEDDDPPGNQSDSGESTNSSNSSKNSVSSNVSGRKRAAADFDSDCSSLSDNEDEDDDDLFRRPLKRCAYRSHAPNKAPIEPAALATTKFTCDKNLMDIECILRDYFSHHSDLMVQERFHSFLLDQTRSRFLCPCNFRVNIYTPAAFMELDGGIEQHIVEVMYEDGDKYIFYEFFAEIKDALLAKKGLAQEAIHEIIKDITITAPRSIPPVC